MLTIQQAEKHGIKASTITFEFGGVDGTEGILLVDDVPEADAIISGGSIEKPYTIPDVDRVVGGDVMRLNKEAGGVFPPADQVLDIRTDNPFLSGRKPVRRKHTFRRTVLIYLIISFKNRMCRAIFVSCGTFCFLLYKTNELKP